MKTIGRASLIALSALVFSLGGYYFGTAQPSGEMRSIGQIKVTGGSPGTKNAVLDKITDGVTTCFVVRTDGMSASELAVDCVE
jgi:hypothetical protein